VGLGMWNGTWRATRGSLQHDGHQTSTLGGYHQASVRAWPTHQKASFPVCHPLATWSVQTGCWRQMLSFIPCQAIARLWNNPIAGARYVKHDAGCYWAMPGLARGMDALRQIDVALPARSWSRCRGHEQADGHGGCTLVRWGMPHQPPAAALSLSAPLRGLWMTCRAKGRLTVAPSWAGRKSCCCQAVICPPRLLSNCIIGDLANHNNAGRQRIQYLF
jgi:hypothetical protein